VVFTPASLRLLRASNFLSCFDRFSAGPMLVLIAAGLGVPLAKAVAMASVYYLCYAVGQPVWGLVSDRIGRARVLQISLAGGAIAAAVSALAPNVDTLLIARALAGGLFGAAIPTGLTYVGDTVPVEQRQRPLADLQTATAIGTAVATVVAGFAAQYASWRLVFAAPALVGAYLAIMMRRLAEPERTPSSGVFAPIWWVLRSRWALFVFLIAFVEGGVLLGLLTYLAPALEARGVSASLAGMLSALYGLGTLFSAQLLKRLVGRRAPATLILIGGTAMCIALLLVTFDQSPVVTSATALLLGGGYSFMHSTLQSWATMIAPRTRATGVSLFVFSLFLGSALATTLASGAADGHRYGAVFGVAAALCVPLTLAATWGRARYDTTQTST
jgi:predicted MFS family arabinose efflux permease